MLSLGNLTFYLDSALFDFLPATEHKMFCLSLEVVKVHIQSLSHKPHRVTLNQILDSLIGCLSHKVS